jgi:hypothetical protein
MKKFASVIVAAVLMSAAACKGSSSSNLLIGTWALDRSGAAPNPYCLAQLTFAEKTYSAPDVNGKVNTIPVTYVTGDSNTFPTVVYVLTDAGITYHTTYNFPSRDKMILDTAAQCAYVRT